MIIGIEGPAGAGKSTMAKTVAAELGATVIEGDVWYRALTYRAQKEGVGSDDTPKLLSMAENLGLEVAPGDGGETIVFLNGRDAMRELYADTVSTAIALIAQNLEVRKVIDPQIIKSVRSQKMAIIVGRHLKRALPEAAVMRISIDEHEADRRHLIRAGESAQSVADRNATDKVTAQILGTVNEGVTTVDVTHFSPDEQAEVLRQFIAAQQ